MDIEKLITSEVYGPVAQPWQELLKKVKDVNWFRAAPTSSENSVKSLVNVHLQALGVHSVGSGCQIVTLPLDLAWLKLQNLEPWRDTRGKAIAGAMQTITETPELNQWIRPPLWLFEGNSSCCQVVFIANEVVLEKNLNLTRQHHLWDAAWNLLCDYEFTIWGALHYELLRTKVMVSNPFLPLLEMYSQAWWPIGLVEGAFVVAHAHAA
jgi:hypothetical protein